MGIYPRMSLVSEQNVKDYNLPECLRNTFQDSFQAVGTLFTIFGSCGALTCHRADPSIT